ncbi:sce7725 family protein [Porticoccus sp. GXU_MW_L64]
MYHPYFRGKQYELITIRESVETLKKAGFVPIIEPVKEALGGLQKTLVAIQNADAEAVVIVNPYHGDHSNNGNNILALMQNEFVSYSGISPGILLTEELTVDDVVSIYSQFQEQNVTFIHAGFSEARLLVGSIGNSVSTIRHIFHDESCGKLYQKHFRKAERILLRDGFQKRTNREHPEVEFFSDLHATFDEEGMDGFGDFLIVGDDYSESGGPAYAVAIHLTFIDPDKDDEMHIHHFKSIRQDDPKDPAGKFAEALEKLVGELQRDGNNILRTEAVNEFIDLHKRGHFPGLGYVKKLSMKHHIETLANYFSS